MQFRPRILDTESGTTYLRSALEYIKGIRSFNFGPARQFHPIILDTECGTTSLRSVLVYFKGS
jgi:hypothetical protein